MASRGLLGSSDSLNDSLNLDSEPSEYGGYSSADDDDTPLHLSQPARSGGAAEVAAVLHDANDGESSYASESEEEDEGDGKGAGFTIPSGWQLRETYTRQGRASDIVAAVYNAAKNIFAVVDKKGVSLWDPAANAVIARHDFPAFQHQLLSHIVAVESLNVYIVYAKDMTLRVLNKDLVELSCTRCENRPVLSLLFLEESSELVTGAVGGFTVWTYAKNHNSNLPDSIGVLKARHNYVLTPARHVDLTPDAWVTSLQLERPKGTPLTGGGPRLVVMVGGDVLFYDVKTFTQVFAMRGLHDFPITSCLFFPAESCYLTTSRDSKVRVWNERGVKVKTFHSHTRDVTFALAHPTSPSLAITSSLDGSIRMWHVGTLTEMYAVQMPGSPLLTLGHKDAGHLFCVGKREVHIWGLNHVMDLWALARAPARVLRRERCAGKSTRLLVACDDGSARLISRTGRAVTTLLPPPTASPSGQVEGIAYSRLSRLMFILLDTGAGAAEGAKAPQTSQEIWVYTARTDPCCRVDVWSAESLKGVSPVCLASYAGPVVLTGRSGGDVCPDAYDYLLIGTRRGHVLFYDTQERGVRHHELKADKDPIVSIDYHLPTSTLVTCALGLDAVVALWSMPTLEPCGTVRCPVNITCMARLGPLFMTGHADGSIQLYDSSQMSRTRGAGGRSPTPSGIDRLKGSLISFAGTAADAHERSHTPQPPTPTEGQPVLEAAASTEHLGAVFSVDCIESLRLFCSAGADGTVRIWDEWKNLLREIAINPTLRCACFLSQAGDIVLSADSHIYIVHPEIYIPSSHAAVLNAIEGADDEVLSRAGSATFEEFDVYDSALTGAEAMTLQNYLVPYSVELQKQWYVEGKPPPPREVEVAAGPAVGEMDAEEHATADEEPERMTRTSSATSLESLSTVASSRVPTEIYLSEPPTPGLSALDALDSLAWDDHMPMLLGSPTDVRSAASSCLTSPSVQSECESDEESEVPSRTPSPQPRAESPTSSALRTTTSYGHTVSFADERQLGQDGATSPTRSAASSARRSSVGQRGSPTGSRRGSTAASRRRSSIKAVSAAKIPNDAGDSQAEAKRRRSSVKPKTASTSSLTPAALRKASVAKSTQEVARVSSVASAPSVRSDPEPPSEASQPGSGAATPRVTPLLLVPDEPQVASTAVSRTSSAVEDAAPSDVDGSADEAAVSLANLSRARTPSIADPQPLSRRTSLAVPPAVGRSVSPWDPSSSNALGTAASLQQIRATTSLTPSAKAAKIPSRSKDKRRAKADTDAETHKDKEADKDAQRKKKRREKKARAKSEGSADDPIAALGIHPVPVDPRARSAPLHQPRVAREPPRPRSVSYYRPVPNTTHRPQIIVPNEYMRPNWDTLVLQRDAERREKKRERMLAAAARRSPDSELPSIAAVDAALLRQVLSPVSPSFSQPRTTTAMSARESVEEEPVRASTPVDDDAGDSGTPPPHFKMGLVFSVVLPYRHRMSNFPAFPPEVEGLREDVARTLFRGPYGSATTLPSASGSSRNSSRPPSARGSAANLAVVSSAAAAATAHLVRPAPPRSAPPPRSPPPRRTPDAPVPTGPELVLMIDRLGEQHVRGIASRLVRETHATRAVAKPGHLLPLLRTGDPES